MSPYEGFKWKWKSLSCVWLCDPKNYTVHGIVQARILEWVIFPFSRGSSQPRDWTQVSHIVGRFFTNWATREAQEYWSGSSFPSPANLPNPGIEPRSPALWADSLPTEPQGKPKNTGVGSLSLLQRIFLTRNRTGDSCIAGGFFTNWATREAHEGLNFRARGNIPALTKIETMIWVISNPN